MNQTPVSPNPPILVAPRPLEPIPQRAERRREEEAPVVEERDKYDISTLACTD